MQFIETMKKKSAKRRPLPKRPRLGNTWQNWDWRRKLITHRDTRLTSGRSLLFAAAARQDEAPC